MSGRGTITSRQMVSPSSKTEWIIFRSPSSMTSEAVARSTSSRSSVSVANGPRRKPRPGVIALARTMSSCGSGPRTFVRIRTGPAVAVAIAAPCWRPRVRGATPTTTKATRVMIPTLVTTVGHQAPSKWSCHHRATPTTAAASHAMRSSSTVLRCRAGSSRMATSEAAPARRASTSSSARARENWDRALSTMASTLARTTRSTTAPSSVGPLTCVCPSVRAWSAPPSQELVLETEHLLVLLRLRVVVAEQVEDAVHGEQLDLGQGPVPRRHALLLRHRGAEDEVAQDAFLRLLVDLARAQLVHREGQHVGGALLLHPLLVEPGDGLLVDRLDAQLRLGVDPHGVHDEAAQ